MEGQPAASEAEEGVKKQHGGELNMMRTGGAGAAERQPHGSTRPQHTKTKITPGKRLTYQHLLYTSPTSALPSRDPPPSLPR